MQNNFLKTAKAFEELETAISSAEHLVEQKQAQIKQRLSEMDSRLDEGTKKIAKLQNTADSAAQNIDNVINRLNNMLVENGSGNNNN